MNSDAAKEGSCDPLYKVACIESLLKTKDDHLCNNKDKDCYTIHESLSEAQRKLVCDTIKSMNMHHHVNMFNMCDFTSFSSQ